MAMYRVGRSAGRNRARAARTARAAARVHAAVDDEWAQVLSVNLTR
jgi:hypothetical protein